MRPSIVWLRQDLRTADQPALSAAALEGPVLPVYILDDERPGEWKIGAAQRWWLHGSLVALAGKLDRLGAPLTLRSGDSITCLMQLAAEVGAETVHCVRHHEPWWAAAEAELADRITVNRHEADTLSPTETIHTRSGATFKRFAPFWRALSSAMPPRTPAAAPEHLMSPDRLPRSERLKDWALRPRQPNWARAFEAEWNPGEEGAHAMLHAFKEQVGGYGARRDLPSDDEGTSRLSPHLHFGEISPATIWHALDSPDAAPFLRELAWRDFARQMISACPRQGAEHGRAEFRAFPWRSGPDAEQDFRTWAAGRTGYPIVDAGMRQLWSIGWMHNRVRMIGASFLVKHLLLDWRRGERWFWDTLVDADYANNSLNWQWVAGSGVDANPLFRIMAPLVQSEKFDAAAYVRRWVPELRGVPDSAIHDPEEIARLGVDYPIMIVGHREARERALSAYRSMRASRD